MISAKRKGNGEEIELDFDVRYLTNSNFMKFVQLIRRPISYLCSTFFFQFDILLSCMQMSNGLVRL